MGLTEHASDRTPIPEHPDGSGKASANAAMAEQKHEAAVRLHKAGRLDEALALYEQALEANPDAPEILANLGTLLRLIGRTGDAVRHVERALAIRPDFSPALATMSTILVGAADAELGLTLGQRPGRSRRGSIVFSEQARLRQEAPHRLCLAGFPRPCRRTGACSRVRAARSRSVPHHPLRRCVETRSYHRRLCAMRRRLALDRRPFGRRCAELDQSGRHRYSCRSGGTYGRKSTRHLRTPGGADSGHLAWLSGDHRPEKHGL